jgi:chromosome segregation ATPase
MSFKTQTKQLADFDHRVRKYKKENETLKKENKALKNENHKLNADLTSARHSENIKKESEIKDITDELNELKFKHTVTRQENEKNKYRIMELECENTKVSINYNIEVDKTLKLEDEVKELKKQLEVQKDRKECFNLIKEDVTFRINDVKAWVYDACTKKGLRALKKLYSDEEIKEYIVKANEYINKTSELLSEVENENTSLDVFYYRLNKLNEPIESLFVYV